MNNFAETATLLGDLQAARELHEEALAGYRRILGDDHPYTLWSISNLAATLTELGDLPYPANLLWSSRPAKRSSCARLTAWPIARKPGRLG
jgi:hypothetical protein